MNSKTRKTAEFRNNAFPRPVLQKEAPSSLKIDFSIKIFQGQSRTIKIT